LFVRGVLGGVLGAGRPGPRRRGGGAGGARRPVRRRDRPGPTCPVGGCGGGGVRRPVLGPVLGGVRRGGRGPRGRGRRCRVVRGVRRCLGRGRVGGFPGRCRLLRGRGRRGDRREGAGREEQRGVHHPGDVRQREVVQPPAHRRALADRGG